MEHKIKERLEDLDAEGLPYSKDDMIQLIIFIEKCKIRFWQGDISAKELLHEVNTEIDRFKMQHPKFDFLNDSALNAYYSKTSDSKSLS